jgi:epoxyqueuosine reductase
LEKGMDSNEIIKTIKFLSHQLGFIEVGIALPKRPAHFNTFLTWLNDGHSGGMSYLGTKRSITARENPQNLIPECRSVILFLARYLSGVPADNRTIQNGRGRVSTYAWGEDYHIVLLDKLERLMNGLISITGHPVMYRGFTDSAPLLEREMAAVAGLGWIGRNSCLISPKHGSFTFISEVLTDLPLEPDLEIVPDRCGSCHRCLDACPTQCILPNRTIAAERCISYLTIENRGQISDELRPLMGDRVFGCDICQSVCPWNSKIDDSQVDGLFYGNDRIQNLELGPELTLTENEFKHIYHDSPVLRARRSGYLRNVALVLGNQGDTRNRSLVLHVIRNEKDAVIRAAAIWAASQMMDEQMRDQLLAIHASESNKSVRDELSRILSMG